MSERERGISGRGLRGPLLANCPWSLQELGQEANEGKPAVVSHGSSGLEVLLGVRRAGAWFSGQGRKGRCGEAVEREGKGKRGQRTITLVMDGNT